jgi:hypothetical protein
MLMIQYMFLALKGTKKVANKDSFRHFFYGNKCKKCFWGRERGNEG